mmetsp:Transcript_34870/g.73562  ORF Transcript_34870/g.73562 Transcript_34870/m.73562 type:complete len:381 (+) Transcript_34870:282-1424(+)
MCYNALLVWNSHRASTKVIIIPNGSLNELLHRLKISAGIRMGQLDSRKGATLHLRADTVGNVVAQNGVLLAWDLTSQKATSHDFGSGQLSRSRYTWQTLVRHGRVPRVEYARVRSNLTKEQANVGDFRLVLGGNQRRIIRQLVLIIVVREDAEHNLGPVGTFLDAALTIQLNSFVHRYLRANNVMTSQDEGGVTLLVLVQQLCSQLRVPGALNIQNLRSATQSQFKELKHFLNAFLVVRPRSCLACRANRVDNGKGIINHRRATEWQGRRTLRMRATHCTETLALVQNIKPGICFGITSHEILRGRQQIHAIFHGIHIFTHGLYIGSSFLNLWKCKTYEEGVQPHHNVSTIDSSSASNDWRGEESLCNNALQLQFNIRPR